MIRAATPADAPAIAALWNVVIADSAATFNSQTYDPAAIARLVEDRAALGHATLVADTGTILGFATYARFRSGIGYAHTMEHTIHLDPAAQGRGLGRALMAALEDHAARAGAHSMIAGVTGENAAGRAFHARLGYAEIARLPEVGRKFGRWMDLILMQKMLRAFPPAPSPDLG